MFSLKELKKQQLSFFYENADSCVESDIPLVEDAIAEDIQENPGDGYRETVFSSFVNVNGRHYTYSVDIEFDEEAEEWMFDTEVTVKRTR